MRYTKCILTGKDWESERMAGLTIGFSASSETWKNGFGTHETAF